MVSVLCTDIATDLPDLVIMLTITRDRVLKTVAPSDTINVVIVST